MAGRNPFKVLMTKVKSSATPSGRSIITADGKKLQGVEASGVQRIVAINAEDLERKFKEQAGLCYWTGQPIDINLIFTSDYNKLAPSVDRIDENKGYTYDNVCITFRFINFGRGNCSVEKTRNYIKVITGNYKVINNKKQKGDNMDIIDKVVERAFDLGTPDAARFLKVFAETTGDYKSLNTNGKPRNTLSPYQSNKKRMLECIDTMKEKGYTLVDGSNTDMVSLVDKLKSWEYSQSSMIKPTTLLGGRVGRALANGVKLGFNTSNPSFDNPSRLLQEMFVPNNMPNPKG